MPKPRYRQVSIEDTPYKLGLVGRNGMGTVFYTIANDVQNTYNVYLLASYIMRK